ncbi:MAG: NAD-dependent epimerase/dehydratase family protein [Nanoarchaeota archaeon]
MAKILVTGGAGFLGSNLVNELMKRGNELIVFDNGFRQEFNNIEKIKRSISLIKGDISKKEDWNAIPKDIEFAYHLAAINGTKFFYEIPEKVLKVNVEGTFNFVDWLRNSQVKRVFFTSSSEVYGFPKIFPTPETEEMNIPDPTNPRFSYSSSKMLGEIIIINFVKSLGIDYSIGRIHNAYGPQMGFEHVMPEFIKRCVLNEPFTVQGDGTESRCFCYVSDIIKAILTIMDSDLGKNEIFNIGNPHEDTINEMIKILEKIHGKKIVPEYRKFDKPGTKRRVPDITKLKRLGYTPSVTLEEGLKKTYDWYAEYYLKK